MRKLVLGLRLVVFCSYCFGSDIYFVHSVAAVIWMLLRIHTFFSFSLQSTKYTQFHNKPNSALQRKFLTRSCCLHGWSWFLVIVVRLSITFACSSAYLCFVYFCRFFAFLQYALCHFHFLFEKKFEPASSSCVVASLTKINRSIKIIVLFSFFYKSLLGVKGGPIRKFLEIV